MTKDALIFHKDKILTLEISENRTAVYLTINDSSEVIDADDIANLLEEAGVVSGFEEAARINSIQIHPKEYNKKILVAKGSEVDQKPIEYYFNVGLKFTPNRLHWGNLKSTNLFEKKSPIATLCIPSETPITDIFGNSISDENLVYISPDKLLGENVYYDEENHTINASIKGYAFKDDSDKLNVTDKIEIIDTLHNVEVATYGELIIHGDVVDSHILHEGNLFVEGNIKDCLGNGIMVRGNLDFLQAENSLISASGSITFQNHINYCSCFTNSYLQGFDNSSFVGGIASAAEFIEIDKIGSPFRTQTHMEISIAPFQKQLIKNHITKIVKLKHSSTEYLQLSEQLAKEEDEFMIELEKCFQQTHESYICAKKVLYSNTSLRVLDKKIITKKDHEYYRFAKNES